jgi:hypothetical protein
MLLLPALLVGAVIAVVWAFLMIRRPPRRTAHGRDPLKELEIRYVQGEVTRQQYLEMKQDIDPHGVPDPRKPPEGSPK